MAKGKAPIGYDLKKIVLHHVRGIANNMDDIVEIGADAHRAFHGTFGYKNFIDWLNLSIILIFDDIKIIFI